MGVQVEGLRVQALDPRRVAVFWAGLLGRVAVDEGEGVWAVVAADGSGVPGRFVPHPAPKAAPNRLHPDLTSTSAADQTRTVARALDLGARHVDVGQRPEEGHVVLADPEGNEFCVLEPGNRFTEGCGFLGALAGEGSRRVGLFWSAVLDWPLVWDQDEETAVRSPRGGPKVTWGGPPLPDLLDPDRIRVDLVADPGSDVRTEVTRLVALGATPLASADEGGAVALADPDGNRFRVRVGR